MARQTQKSTETLIKQYLTTLRDKKRTGKAGEHAYRTALETLISGLDDSLEIVPTPGGFVHPGQGQTKGRPGASPSETIAPRTVPQPG